MEKVVDSNTSRMFDGTILHKVKGLPEENPRILLDTIMNLKLRNFPRIIGINKDDDGYVLSYALPDIHDEQYDFLEIPKDYLLDSYANMACSLEALGNESIYAHGLILPNTIKASDGIYASSYDQYTFMDKPYYAKLRNKAVLNVLFRELMLNEIKNKYYLMNQTLVGERINKLFNPETDYQKLEELLKKYNVPLDYLNSYAKR